mgnify:CR=1 FL=1
MLVDFSKIETELWTYFFSEWILEVFYLGGIFYCCVNAGDYFLLRVAEILVKEAWVNSFDVAVAIFLGFFLHAVEEYTSGFSSISFTIVLTDKSHWIWKQDKAKHD